MSIQYYSEQLQRKYIDALRQYLSGQEFSTILLRGGKKKPDNTVQLHEAVRAFQEAEKTAASAGWVIEWEEWSSKKLGKQLWPATIQVNSLPDLLFLLKKEKEFACFQQQAKQLQSWRTEIRTWLIERPDAVLRYESAWTGICAVVDYFLDNPRPGQYLRSLPVPVHTKFIETYERVIVSLLHHFLPATFGDPNGTLETLALLPQKPVLFTLRWLDPALATELGFNMDVLALSPNALRKMDWPVQELWLVENETALYMLPPRPSALAIYSRGKALDLLSDIPFFHRARLHYWGDMDEEGYYMLARCRKLYPHVKSICMSEMDFQAIGHLVTRQPALYSAKHPEELHPEELRAFQQLRELNGRIEQEQLPQQYLHIRIETR